MDNIEILIVQIILYVGLFYCIRIDFENIVKKTVNQTVKEFVKNLVEIVDKQPTDTKQTEQE